MIFSTSINIDALQELVQISGHYVKTNCGMQVISLFIHIISFHIKICSKHLRLRNIMCFTFKNFGQTSS